MTHILGVGYVYVCYSILLSVLGRINEEEDDHHDDDDGIECESTGRVANDLVVTLGRNGQLPLCTRALQQSEDQVCGEIKM